MTFNTEAQAPPYLSSPLFPENMTQALMIK